MLAEFFIPKFGEWQLFGKQMDFMNASLRPKRDEQGLVLKDEYET